MLRPKLKLVENAPADPNGPPALGGQMAPSAAKMLSKTDFCPPAIDADQAERLMRSQGSGHGRKPDNQEQNATGRPRQPTMFPKTS
jgi:hypothetical protein